MADEDNGPAVKAEPRPTQAALRKKPRAVIVAEWVKTPDRAANDLDAIEAVSHTFEWFDNEAAMNTYYDELTSWAKSTVNGDPDDDGMFFVGEVTDTQPDLVTFGRWVVEGRDRDHVDVYMEAILNNPLGPNFFVVPSKPRAAGKRKVKPKVVKGRKPSTAAGLVKVEAKSKRKAVPKGKVRPRKPNADVAALKERLKGELVGMGAAPEAVDEALSPADDNA